MEREGIGRHLKEPDGIGEHDNKVRVCPVLCVNDLDFVVGFGFVVVLGFGDGLQGKGFPPSLA